MTAELEKIIVDRCGVVPNDEAWAGSHSPKKIDNGFVQYKNEIRGRLIAKQNNRCLYCHAEMTSPSETDPRSVTLEHLIPVTCGGTNDESNLRVACRECNSTLGSILGQTGLRDGNSFIGLGTPECPWCGGGKLYAYRNRPGTFICADPKCRRVFSETSHTMLRARKIPVHVYRRFVGLLVTGSRSINEMTKLCGVQYKTANSLAHRIYSTMTDGKAPETDCKHRALGKPPAQMRIHACDDCGAIFIGFNNKWERSGAEPVPLPVQEDDVFAHSVKWTFRQIKPCKKKLPGSH